MKKELNDLIFFVHIPKTAGSSINHHMEKSFSLGYAHAESFISDEEKLREYVANAQWMSGHINYSLAKEKLEAATERRIRYYSCMREPKAQVMSHLNWLIEIQHRSKRFFYDHPVRIQEISHEILSVGLNNKHNVMYLLMKYRGLLLNTQCKLILEKNVDLNQQLMKQTISEYDYIGTDKSIDKLIYRITDHKPNRVERVNASQYHFDTSLFDDEEISYFLKVHNALDMKLYSLAG